MERKELFKQIISDFQEGLPIAVVPREISIPLNTSKIITTIGVRRSGKTSLMYDCINRLLKAKVKPEQILFINFDDERFDLKSTEYDLIIQAYHELFPHIKRNSYYIFFDEIQMADNWEQFVRRLYETETKNIFLSGSNSKMLASEIATSLRGRTIHYEVFPLSFREYCSFKNLKIDLHSSRGKGFLKKSFNHYLVYGGFPEVVLDEFNLFENMLQEYYFLMLHKDLVERYQIKNITALKYFVRRIISNLTKPTAINKIYNEMKSAGLLLSKNLLYELAEYLEAIYLFQQLTRFDYSIVKSSFADRKYYLIDNGFKKALIGGMGDDYGLLLENAVFLWLRRQKLLQRGLHFFHDNKECDFVLFDRDKPEKLFQACWSLANEETRTREITGITNAADYLKCKDLTIITSDEEAEIKTGKHVIKIIPAWKAMLG